MTEDASSEHRRSPHSQVADAASAAIEEMTADIEAARTRAKKKGLGSN
jgi:hypothetical protein